MFSYICRLQILNFIIIFFFGGGGGGGSEKKKFFWGGGGGYEDFVDILGQHKMKYI